MAKGLLLQKNSWFMIWDDSGGSEICFFRYRYIIINKVSHFYIKIDRIFQKVLPKDNLSYYHHMNLIVK